MNNFPSEIYFLDTNIIRHHIVKFKKEFANAATQIPYIVQYEIANSCISEDKKLHPETFCSYYNKIFSDNGVCYAQNDELCKLLRNEIKLKEYYKNVKEKALNNVCFVMSNFMCIFLQYKFKKDTLITFCSDEEFSKKIFNISNKYISCLIKKDLAKNINIKDYVNKQLLNKLLVIFDCAYNLWRNESGKKTFNVNSLKIKLDSVIYNDSEIYKNTKDFIESVSFDDLIIDRNNFLTKSLINLMIKNLTNKQDNRIEFNNIYDYIISWEYLEFAKEYLKHNIKSYFITNDNNFILFSTLYDEGIDPKLKSLIFQSRNLCDIFSL